MKKNLTAIGIFTVIGAALLGIKTYLDEKDN